MPITGENESVLIDFSNMRAADQINSQNDLNFSHSIKDITLCPSLVQMGVLGSSNVKVN
jgi:hypothetical protein